MKSAVLSSFAALAAQQVAGHSLFQQLWVDGTDMGSQCIRMPQSNSPVTNYAGNDIRCNVGGTRGVAGKCAVKAGGTVTVEMHAQPGDRNCKNEAIGGNHYGPVTVYLSKVDNAATSDGSQPFFKIYENGWSSKNSARGDDDNWGVKDLNACCGKAQVLIPTNIPNGDYLLRAEVLALHTAGSSGGAQSYPACYQITVTGGTGTAIPTPNAKFPGAYKASDPGVLVNIHGKLSNYIVPGPAVVAGGTVKVAGSGCAKS